MKYFNHLVFCLILLLAAQNAFCQKKRKIRPEKIDCEYQAYGEDQFKGNKTVTTISYEFVPRTGKGFVNVAARKIDDQILLWFSVRRRGYFAIDKDNEVLVKLIDGTVCTGKAFRDRESIVKDKKKFHHVKMFYIFSTEDIEKMMRTPVVAVRVYDTGDGYADYNIEDEFAERIMDVLKCVNR